MSYVIRRIKNKIRLPAAAFKWLNLNKPQFDCPLCNYHGPFRNFDSFAGLRLHVQCPRCGALERHRLQYLVVVDVLTKLDTENKKMLHIAPEPFFRNFFSSRFGTYETADLNMSGVDHRFDLQNAPFQDESYDFVFASHVLEHVADDVKAIREIRRILKPGGIAILPVPLVCEKTIEYPEANPNESYHMRAPGLDYVEKYQPYFSKVETRASDSVPERFQTFIYEDRRVWPTKACPYRPPMQGERHLDLVPICYV